MNSASQLAAALERTVGFPIDDSVLHMRHHLDPILRRSPVTRCPRG